VALYQHLGPARHFLLRPVFGLCCDALGLSSELLARRNHYHAPDIRHAHCRRLARSPGSLWKPADCEVSHVRNGTHMDIAFEVWTGQGTWFWYVVNPHRNGGTIGAAATETEAIREARSSIEEMSARRPRVASAQFTRDAAAMEESNPQPTASSSASRTARIR
jgi:hypothetical protein